MSLDVASKAITFYVKLQNAYVTEAAAIGNYATIGYEMASTSNFDYSEPTNSWSDVGTLSIPGSNLNVWNAKAKVALNNCDQNSEWTLAVKTGGVGVEFEGGIGDGASATIGTFDSDCLALTAGFKTISDNN